MNKELVQLAIDKGFIPLVSHELDIVRDYSTLNDEDVNYICLCEIQKWLRETHGISVSVYPVEFVSGSRVIEQDDPEYTYWIFVKGVKEFPLSSQIHDTYTETLEHALKRGLNVIKNEKE